jgi:hypothetical protein
VIHCIEKEHVHKQKVHLRFQKGEYNDGMNEPDWSGTNNLEEVLVIIGNVISQDILVSVGVRNNPGTCSILGRKGKNGQGGFDGDNQPGDIKYKDLKIPAKNGSLIYSIIRFI